MDGLLGLIWIIFCVGIVGFIVIFHLGLLWLGVVWVYDLFKWIVRSILNLLGKGKQEEWQAVVNDKRVERSEYETLYKIVAKSDERPSQTLQVSERFYDSVDIGEAVKIKFGNGVLRSIEKA